MPNITTNHAITYTNKAPFIWRKPVPGRRVNLPAEFIFSGCLYEKKDDPFPRAESARTARACSGCPDLTGLTPLGEPKCLLLEKSWPGYEDVPTIPKG